MPDSEGGAATARRVWPYAKEYRHVLREGHHRQAPACGSPTLVMHWAIWPRHAFGDPLDGKLSPQAISASADEAQQRCAAYDIDNARFFDDISAFAVRLQELGRVADPKQLTMETAQLPEYPTPNGRKDETHSFKVCNPQGLAFTLWWSDDTGPGKPNRRPMRPHAPKATDLRVRVHLQTHRDHATVSFYIDIAKSYGAKQVDDAADILDPRTGVRRSRLMQAIQVVRRVSGEQVRKGYVELARIPEHAVEAHDAEKLLKGADYIYDGIWREFAEAFEMGDLYRQADDEATDPSYGQRFADFRGLVMSIRGLETTGEDKRRQTQKTIRERNTRGDRARIVGDHTDRDLPDNVPFYDSGTIGFGPLTKFDEKSNEANTVLKSLWPFMRRIAPWADHRNWVGCGIIGGRALYITPLGSEPSTDTPGEESPDEDKIDIPGGHLPKADASDRARPLRYLIVTKGEPHREQLGRYVERINSIGTMRLFALRNIASIRNASVHVEVLARMLDGTLKDWERERKRIDDYFRTARNRMEDSIRAAKRYLPRDAEPADGAAERKHREDLAVNLHPTIHRIEARHTNSLNTLVRKTEGRLIQIAGRLDSIGEGGSGRMLYVARRADYFASEFTRLYQTLAIVDVEGWINYKNFVDRSMQPAFEFIRATEARLRFIRERIQIVTDTIQTSALIVETSATRENTTTLKMIARSWWLRFGGGGILAIALTNILNKVKEDWPSVLWEAVKAAIALGGAAPL